MNKLSNIPILHVDIFNTHADIEYPDYGSYPSNIGVVKKTITINDFKSIFNTSDLETPFFPFGVLKYAEKNGNFYLVNSRYVNTLEYKIINGRTSRIDYKTELASDQGFDVYHFHMPYFYFMWKGQIRAGKKYFLSSCVLYTSFFPPDLNTNIYIPNLGNVYSSGQLCWGSNQVFKEFKDWHYIINAENVFLMSIHTNEMVGINDISSYANKRFDSEVEFKQSNLVKRNTEITLDSAIKNFIGTE